MKIGISGASGQLGTAIVKQLRTRGDGQHIVGISRTPQNIIGADEVRQGDYDDPGSLLAAYQGLDRLFIIITADLQAGKRAAQNVAAIDAAVAAGVGHVVFLSSAGTRDAAEPGVWASYHAGEQRLVRSTARWSILRMNYYAEAFVAEAKNALASGVLTGLAEGRVAFVSRDDVAAAAAGLLTGEGHAGATYNATGPRTFSGAERAALVSEIGGKPVAFTVLPEETLRDGLAHAGLPGVVIEAVVSIQHGFAVGGYDIVTGDIERLSGKPPRRLEDVLRASLAPA